MKPKLGIVAGEGSLPRELYDAALKQGRDVFVLALEGQADPKYLEGVPHQWFRMTAVGRGVEICHEVGIGELVLTGDFQPWHLFTHTPDSWLVRRLPQIMGRMRRGENEVVAFLIEELEKEGLRVVSARDFAAGLFPEQGTLGRHEANTESWMDISIGVEAAKAIGALDIGQAVIVQNRIVLAVEAVEGTNALIRRTKELQKGGTGAILVKMKKPQQELRADPPTIGPETIRLAADAGFRGVAVEAGAAMIVDRPTTVATADDAGLFLVAVAAAE